MPQAAKSLPQKIDLSGKYCRLEPLNEAAHGKDLWNLAGSYTDVWTHLLNGPWTDEQEFLQWIKFCENHPSRTYYAIVNLKSGIALGALSLIDCNLEHASGEIGGIFFSPQLQKTTIATEAVYLLSRYFFDDLGNRRLYWKCDANNAASEKAALRFGFTFEGTFRQHMIIKGKNRDSMFFSILDGEWDGCREAFEQWLDEENFDASGMQKVRLEDLRLAKIKNQPSK